MTIKHQADRHGNSAGAEIRAILESAVQPAGRLHLGTALAERSRSSVTLAELSYGVSVLPKGKRRQRLTAAIEGVVELFAERLLAFDADAARRYGVLAATARASGRGFPAPDGYIAAVAAARAFAVASRDPTVFAAVGLTVIDPWRAAVAADRE